MPCLRNLVMVFSLCVLLFVGINLQAKPEKAPYLDVNLPIERRVEDLLARMSLREKIGQLNLASQQPGNRKIPHRDGEDVFVGGFELFDCL